MPNKHSISPSRHMPFWKNFVNNPKSVSSENSSTPSRPVYQRGHSYNHTAPKTGSPIKNEVGAAERQDFRDYRDQFSSGRNGFSGRVFGVSLEESSSVASAEVIVQSESVSFGRIPIVVAKCGAYSKSNGSSTSGVFRIAGNSKRIKESQYIFSTPPDYGAKFSNWEPYTVHDVASSSRRYLNNLEEPSIPLASYEKFRAPSMNRPRILKYMLNNEVSHPNANKENTLTMKLTESTKQDTDDRANDGDNENEDEQHITEEEAKRKQSRRKKKSSRCIRAAIKEYEESFTDLLSDSKQSTIYLSDSSSSFARQSQSNSMSGSNLAAIFQPSILSHPQHDLDPKEYELSRLVVEFSIEYTYKLLPHSSKSTKDDQQKKISESVHQKSTTESTTNRDKTSSPLPNIQIQTETTTIKGTPDNSKTTSTATSQQNNIHSKPEAKSPALQVPKYQRPHSRSIGSAPMVPDVIASNKRRSRLFPWLHKPGILSDTGDTATDGEGDDLLNDDENVDPHLSSPVHSSNHRQHLLSIPKVQRSVSGRSITSNSSGRPLSLILNRSEDNSPKNGSSSTEKFERPRSPIAYSQESIESKAKKRESWFARLTSRN